MITLIVDNRRSVDEVWLLLRKNTMHPINNLRGLVQLPIGRIQKDQLLDAHKLCRLAALALPGLAQIAPPTLDFLWGNPPVPQLRAAPSKNMRDGRPRLTMEPGPTSFRINRAFTNDQEMIFLDLIQERL